MGRLGDAMTTALEVMGLLLLFTAILVGAGLLVWFFYSMWGYVGLGIGIPLAAFLFLTAIFYEPRR